MQYRLATAVTAAIAAIAALLASAADAQVIIDVASGGAASAGPAMSIDPPWTGANGFTLTGTETIRAASFFSLECCTLPWSGTLSYLFFTPDPVLPSLPGSVPFAQGMAAAYLATEVYSDAASNVVRQFDFNLAAPLLLGPGDYFFAIRSTPAPGAGPLAWRLVQDGGGSSASTTSPTFDAWIGQSGEAAFQLHGSTFPISTAPEPAPLVLVAGGLGLLGVAVRAQRRC
jgi:hypothetical protein